MGKVHPHSMGVVAWTGSERRDWIVLIAREVGIEGSLAGKTFKEIEELALEVDPSWAEGYRYPWGPRPGEGVTLR